MGWDRVAGISGGLRNALVRAGTVFGLLGTLLAVPGSVVAGYLIEEPWFRRLEEGAGKSSS
jgi:hypothetical protein